MEFTLRVHPRVYALLSDNIGAEGKWALRYDFHFVYYESDFQPVYIHKILLN